ncbi:PadR family transcriptional regulator [Streptomyces sp. NPDC004111]|uniref:PadR family transcriptional regulator n=1 Tax=Streptomyces sp. NPDC004111 TaxID=3364690 RepID=UPI00369DC78B
MPLKAVDNPLALRLLGLLVERPMHTYALGSELARRYPHVRARSGSLYTLTTSLIDAGWIAPTGTEQAGNRPARTVYALTPQGWQAFRERVGRQVREARVETSAFVDALAYLGALGREEAVAALRERVAALDERIAALETAARDAAGDVPELFMIETAFVGHQMRSESGWIRQLITRITDGTLPWPGAEAAESAPGTPGTPATTTGPGTPTTQKEQS